MKSIYLIALAFVAFSCGNLNHTNFNKQKFTTLKSQHQNEEDVVSAKDETVYKPDSKSDLEENSSTDSPREELAVIHIESIKQVSDDNELSFNSTNNYVLPDEDEYTDSTEKIINRALLLKYTFLIQIDSQWYRIDSARFVGTTHSIEGNLVLVKNIKEYNNERTIKLVSKEYINPNTEFISLHKGQILSLNSKPDIDPGRIPDEKYLGYDPALEVAVAEKDKGSTDSLTKRRLFDLIFKIGLALFLFTILFYVMAAFSASTFMFVASLTAASLGIFTVWILSCVLISMASKIYPSHKNSAFKIELGLAYLVATIGTIVVILFALLLGLLLL